MTTLDDKLVPRISEIITKIGVTATFAVRSTPKFDVDHGDVVHGGTTEHSVLVSPPQAYRDSLVDGQMVKRGDSYIYIAGQDVTFTITEDTEVTVAGVVWKIVAIDRLMTGSEIGAYRLQLRS